MPAFHQTSCQRPPVSVIDGPCHSSGWIHRPTQEFGRLIRRHQESVPCVRFHNRFSPLARQKWLAAAGSLPCSWVVWVSVAVRRSGTLPIGVVGQIVWRWSSRGNVGVLGRSSTEWPSVWDTGRLWRSWHSCGIWAFPSHHGKHLRRIAATNK